MKNPDKVSKEFGNLADLRASDPVTIAAIAKKNKKNLSASVLIAAENEEARDKSLKNVNDNYFNRHFANTPQNAGNMEILPESAEENEQDFLKTTTPIRAARNSFRSHARAQSQPKLITMPISNPGEETK